MQLYSNSKSTEKNRVLCCPRFGQKYKGVAVNEEINCIG